MNTAPRLVSLPATAHTPTESAELTIVEVGPDPKTAPPQPDIHPGDAIPDTLPASEALLDQLEKGLAAPRWKEGERKMERAMSMSLPTRFSSPPPKRASLESSCQPPSGGSDVVNTQRENRFHLSVPIGGFKTVAPNLYVRAAAGNGRFGPYRMVEIQKQLRSPITLNISMHAAASLTMHLLEILRNEEDKKMYMQICEQIFAKHFC